MTNFHRSTLFRYPFSVRGQPASQPAASRQRASQQPAACGHQQPVEQRAPADQVGDDAPVTFQVAKLQRHAAFKQHQGHAKRHHGEQQVAELFVGA